MAEVAKTSKETKLDPVEVQIEPETEPVKPEKKTTPPAPGSSAHAELLRSAK